MPVPKSSGKTYKFDRHPYLELGFGQAIHCGKWLISLTTGAPKLVTFTDTTGVLPTRTAPACGPQWRLNALLEIVRYTYQPIYARYQGHPVYELFEISADLGQAHGSAVRRELLGIVVDYQLYNPHMRKVHRCPTLQDALAYAASLQGLDRLRTSRYN
jgi:hypothetical protein